MADWVGPLLDRVEAVVGSRNDYARQRTARCLSRPFLPSVDERMVEYWMFRRIVLMYRFHTRRKNDPVYREMTISYAPYDADYHIELGRLGSVGALISEYQQEVRDLEWLLSR